VTPGWLPGVHRAPNIQEHPDLYELENRAADPDGRIEQAMWELAPWAGEVVLDVGAGTGFHLEHLSRQARHVLAEEPDDGLRLLADRSVGMAHARFASFVGPGCEPGLAEMARVLRPGGRLFVVDIYYRPS
jgi:ubiquinone/menaquinone biosynthesis C-methylase UbiE